MKFELSQETQRALIQACDMLDTELDKLQAVYSQRSDRWRDSDAGQEVDCWLDDLTAVLDVLNDFKSKPNE